MNIVHPACFSRKVAAIARLALLGLAAACFVALPSCGPGRFVPSKSETGWNGPPIWIESTPEWTVVAKAPTGGWQFTLDQLMEQRGRTEVFVTLKRPNPSYLVTAAEVEQRVTTPLKNNVPIWVYARIQNYRGQPEDGSFALVDKSVNAKAPPERVEKKEEDSK
ncbi:MAG: hypothetical protein K2Y21_04765 [Phycisphaerales bacterium]|nr:hypothetical protein [Phycisphaerales bacterium]